MNLDTVHVVQGIHNGLKSGQRLWLFCNENNRVPHAWNSIFEEFSGAWLTVSLEFGVYLEVHA